MVDSYCNLIQDIHVYILVYVSTEPCECILYIICYTNKNMGVLKVETFINNWIAILIGDSMVMNMIKNSQRHKIGIGLGHYQLLSGCVNMFT